MSRTIAIGDMHGCSEALRTLIGAIVPTQSDTLVTLGDYVDRGPDSRGIVTQLLELQQQCSLIPLMGNHEVMMLQVLDEGVDRWGWKRYGGAATIASYGGELEKVDPEHREFLANCRRVHEIDSHIFMHANYVADLPLAQQPDSVLFWTHISSVLPPPHCSGKTAVVGHTPQTNGEVLDHGHLVCIDTCCFAGGWLTAWDVTTGTTWQADHLGKLRDCRQ